MDERSHWDFAGITRPVASEFGEVMLLGCNSSCGGNLTVNIYAVPNVATSSSGFLLSLVAVDLQKTFNDIVVRASRLWSC